MRELKAKKTKFGFEEHLGPDYFEKAGKVVALFKQHDPSGQITMNYMSQIVTFHTNDEVLAEKVRALCDK